MNNKIYLFFILLYKLNSKIFLFVRYNLAYCCSDCVISNWGNLFLDLGKFLSIFSLQNLIKNQLKINNSCKFFFRMQSTWATYSVPQWLCRRTTWRCRRSRCPAPWTGCPCRYRSRPTCCGGIPTRLSASRRHRPWRHKSKVDCHVSFYFFYSKIKVHVLSFVGLKTLGTCIRTCTWLCGTNQQCPNFSTNNFHLHKW